MLNDASGFQKIYLATGYTDLRRGMEGLANIIRFHFHLDPYDRNTLFLFCGKRTYRIKGSDVLVTASQRDRVVSCVTSTEEFFRIVRSFR